MGDIYLWTLPPIFLPHIFTLFHSPSFSVSLSLSCNLFAPLIFFKGTKIFSLPLIFFPLAYQSSPWRPNPVWNLLLKQTFYPPVPASTIPNQMSTSSVWLTSATLETQSDYPNSHESMWPSLSLASSEHRCLPFPWSIGYTFQDPQWMPEATDSTEPSVFFPIHTCLW